MHSYKYRAVSEKGQVVEDYCLAESEKEIVKMLKENDYYPISIEKSVKRRTGNNVFFKKTTKNDIAIFCRGFYTMLDAGIGIIEILEILKKQTKNKVLKSAIESIYEDVQKGVSLSEGMKSHEEVFPNILINMVEAGELSGNLDLIMEKMAIHFENEYIIENNIKNALIYPMILCIVSIFVLAFLLIVVMPSFVNMFNNNLALLPAPTRILLTIGNYLKNSGFYILVIIVLTIFTLKLFKTKENGRKFFDNLKIKMPGFRTINIKIITSKFTRTLSILLSSGVPLVQALDMVSKVVENQIIYNEIQLAKQDVQKGIPLSETVKKVKLFPSMVVSMMRIGEESGALDILLSKTADFYDIEVEKSMEKINSLLEPLLIIFMSIIIGFIVVAMTLPMFDMINTIVL